MGTVINKPAPYTLDALLNLSLEGAAFTTCFASTHRASKAPWFQRLLLREGASNVFAGGVRDLIAGGRKRHVDGDLQQRPYEADARLAPYEVEVLSLSGDSHFGDQVESLNAVESIDTFAGDSAFVAGLRFHVTTVQTLDGKIAHFFRRYSPVKVLGRSAKWALLFQNGCMDEVRDALFWGDGRIDCVLFEEKVFIFHKGNFHSIFKYYEGLQEKARVTLGKIARRLPIANFQALEEMCYGNMHMLAKVTSIASRGYFEYLTLESIKRAMAKLNRPLEIRRDDTGKEFLVFNPKDKWALLKVLDDDILVSVLTGRYYEANGKREIATPTGALNSAVSQDLQQPPLGVS
jgi:hypothetical protein